MEFFSQLYLLSWKNFTLRRRHKLRQCVELFWPLIIFLILVWVRGRKPPEHMHECHFNGKAMPSAGLLPFFQSLLCYSQNQCHRYPVTSETSRVVDSFNSSGLAEFYEALQDVVSNQTLMWDLISLWNMTRPLPDNFPLGSILSDPDKLRQVQLSPDVMDAIGNADLTPEKFQEILGDQDWRTALCSDTATLRDLLQIDNDALLREVQHELCDLNMFDMLIVLMRLQGLNNQETYQRILSAINGEADWGDTISTITDGLPLSDLLSDTDAVREFLEQNISLSENVTDLLLNSPLTPSQLRSLVDQDNLREIVCNTTLLGQYVDMSDPDTLKELSDQLCQLSDKQLEELADELAGHIRNQLNNTDYEKLFNELRTRLELIDSEFQLLEKLSDGLQGFSANQTMESIFLGLCGNQSDAMEGTMMYGLLGGLRGLDIMNITRDYDNSKNNEMPDEYDKYMKREEDEKNEHEYEYDNETTPFCNSMFRSIESNQFTRILWTRLKPLMVGYVPYSPNSKAARRIIEKASWPFKTLQNIVDLSRDWLEYSPELVEFLNRTELPQLPKSFTDSLKNYSWYEDFVDVYNETLRDKDTWLEAINVLDQLAHTAIDFLQCMNLDRFVGYDTEEEVVTQGLKLMQQNKLWAGIVFSNFDQNPKSNVIPKHVHFKIRMDTDVIESTFKLEDRYWTPGPRSNPAFDLKYIQSGFVFLQDMVEHGIIEATANLDKLNTGVYVQQFPYPCYIDDMFIFFLSFVLPMFMVISWVYSVAMTIKSIVYEKERRLKEVMKVMGLGNGVHWVAWFINSFIMMFISSVLLILLIQYGGLLVYSDLSLVLFFMVTFCISTLMLCFLISTFFSRANLAAACGGIIFLATYVPYVLVSAWEDVMSPAQKILAALVNTVAFGFGCTYFAIYEIQGYGLQWDNIATSPTGSNFTFQMSLIMMWVDAGIYALITWYIEAVFPGQYGMPRPWYFPVTKSYWCENARTNTDMTVDNPTYEMGHRATNDEPQQDNDKTSFEAEPSHLPLGVSIRKLVKIYKNGKKLAVDGLSLNFYEDQITSFLGHNGAGKTTTMSILTGLFPPSSGTAYIYGKDIQTDINSIRKSMGMCPQHNVLFDHLTVEEHMWFYARLKGMSNKEVKVEMEQMIKDVGLPNKRHEKTKHLSGGMKRKLSVAIAFAGGSRVVILDEPTAGVDPYARRSIWDLLSKYRKGRTILLTTHHMDEADILGDRIAIISQGKLKCCGSSLFLKSQFGNGYYLVLVKKSDKLSWKGSDSMIEVNENPANQKEDLTAGEDDDEGIGSELSSQCNTNSTRMSSSSLSLLSRSLNSNSTVSYFDEGLVTTFIQSHVPGAMLAESTGTELTYLLPEGASKSGAFARLFTELDENMNKLSISSYGISDTTLEEIFLKVADESNEPDDKGKDSVNDAGQYPRPFMGLRSLRRKWIEKKHRKQTDRTQLLRDTDAMAVVASPFPSTSTSSNVDLVKCEKKESEPVADEGSVQVASSALTNTAEAQDMDFSLDSDAGSSYEGDLTGDLRGVSPARITGPKRIWRQFQALVIKRFHNSRRNIKAFVAQVLVPVLFVLFMLLCSLLVPPMRQPPSLQLMPWMYERQLYMTYSQDSSDSPFSQSLEQSLQYNPGVGTRCMEPQPVIAGLPCMETDASQWIKPDISQSVKDSYHRFNITDEELSPPCDCSSGSQQCPAGAGGPPPSYRVTQTTEIMYNLTSRNVTDYLVKTSNDYIGKRFGGLSFLEVNGLAVNPATLARAYNNVSQNLNLTQFNMTDDLPSFERVDELQKLYSVVLNMATLNNAKVWWNNNGWHALPTYLNVMSNMLLRANVPSGEKASEYGITVYSHPMNRTEEQMGYVLFLYSSVDLSIATFTVFALAFVPSSFVVYLIQDRSSNAKHLQFVSGLNSVIYWVTHFFWDLCNYCITAFLIIFIFIAFQKDAYVSSSNLPCLMALLLLYGWAVAPLMYPASYVFTIPSTAYVFLACANVIIGIITVTATFILDYMDDEEDLVRINSILKKVFLLFPHYCLGRGMLDMATNQLYADAFSQFGEDIFESPFAWDICGKNLFFLAIEGFVFFGVVLFIQYMAFVNIRCGKDNAKSKPNQEEDDDVYQERQRIVSGNGTTDLLRLENLAKVYRTHTGKKNLAVDSLCVGIPAGQCFGLLGVNGAGKTTTFKMLTGDIRPTSGTAYLNNYNILSELQNVHQNMGYCPQFDALDNLITGREHLEYYARLRGILEKDIKTVAELGIRKLGLVKYADKQVGDYSGGNKRKLSTAISLIGSPPVVFLDEPTTGMDPKAKRFLWKCITNVLKEGRSVILTSHSMEECEALCSRLAIMVNGRFQCLGSTQHLKNRFGDGYMLIIRVGRGAESDTVNLKSVAEFVKRNFPGAVLKEKHHNMLEYQLPSSGTSLAHLFGAMEANRAQLLIEDYSVSQTTLDQVFINFAKMQTDLDDDLITRDRELDLDFSQDTPIPSQVVIDSNLVMPSVKYSTDPLVHKPNEGNPAYVNLDLSEEETIAKENSTDGPLEGSLAVSPINIIVNDYSTEC